MGQNFSWLEQIGYRLDRQELRRQRAGGLYNEDGSICVENGCICFCKPADQRLTHDEEDLPLFAHRQELHLSVEDHGLILSQKMNRPSLVQCQNNWVLCVVMVIFLEMKMERLNSGD